MKKLFCFFGFHKWIFLDVQYEMEIKGKFCEWCGLTIEDK